MEQSLVLQVDAHKLLRLVKLPKRGHGRPLFFLERHSGLLITTFILLVCIEQAEHGAGVAHVRRKKPYAAHAGLSMNTTGAKFFHE